MLNLYVGGDKEYIAGNDTFFVMNTYDKVLQNVDLQKLLETAECVTYIGDGKIISKFTDTSIDMNLMSTGTKTLLNIVAFPDKCFSIKECGMNILELLYMQDSGNAYSDVILTIFADSIKPCRVIVSDKEHICNSVEDLWRLSDEG